MNIKLLEVSVLFAFIREIKIDSTIILGRQRFSEIGSDSFSSIGAGLPSFLLCFSLLLDVNHLVSSLDRFVDVMGLGEIQSLRSGRLLSFTDVGAPDLSISSGVLSFSSDFV